MPILESIESTAKPIRATIRKRPRRVLGRVITTFGGVTYRFEQTRDGIFIRRKYGRRPLRLSFADALEAATGQLQLL